MTTEGRKDPRAGVPSSLTRARVERMVLDIARQMSAGEWDGEKFAAREGVSIDATKQYAARASRWLKAIPQGELAALRARNLERLDDVHDDAADDGDHKARVSAVAEQNKLLGLIVEKHEVTGSFTPERWDGLRSRIVAALEPYPEAKAAVLAAITEK